MVAAQGDFAVTAAELCKHKDINVNLRNEFGLSALDIAVREGSIEVLDVLLQRHDVLVNEGARWSETSSSRFGETPLITATRERRVEVVKVPLRDDRVKRDIRDADGLTALDITIRMDHELLIKALQEERRWNDGDRENYLADEYMNETSLMKYLRI